MQICFCILIEYTDKQKMKKRYCIDPQGENSIFYSLLIYYVYQDVVLCLYTVQNSYVWVWGMPTDSHHNIIVPVYITQKDDGNPGVKNLNLNDEFLCFGHNSPSSTFPPSLSFKSNANVLQPSAQQRRLRIVLRAGFLLADVKPSGGRRATVPL